MDGNDTGSISARNALDHRRLPVAASKQLRT
jgi:hypothetical protein